MADAATTERPKAEFSNEAIVLADAILRAAGSGLHHYSLPGVRSAILTAAQRGLDGDRAHHAAIAAGDAYLACAERSRAALANAEGRQ